ncbi:hypothetical protein [Mucilaginibacter sp.]|uniref:hypothetical protein n=1 Tax=Mucilaginibacter sp. TaxID=1882438 RepID=UPI0025FFF39D|nr:hypothetical protein [Mucilaginibacter sp.]
MVEMGNRPPVTVEVTASAKGNGKLETWLDDLQNGKLIATIPVIATGNNQWKTFSKLFRGITDQKRCIREIPISAANTILIKSIKFTYK